MRNAHASRRWLRDIAGSYRRVRAGAIATAAVLAAALAATSGAAHADQDGDAFRATVREALSRGRDPATLRAHFSEATVEIGGKEAGHVRTWAVREPRALREETDISGVHQVVTLLGDEGWMEDANGGVRPLSGDELFSAVLAHALLFHDYLEKSELTWKEDGKPRSARVNWSEKLVQFRPPTGPPARLQFGAGGLPRRFSQVVEGGVASTTYLDWGPVDGVRWPLTEQQSVGDARFDLTLRTTTASYPDELPSDAIPRPVPRLAADFAITDSTAARSIAVERVGGLVLVPVRVNGHDSRFLLDTGAGATVLDTTFVRELGLESRGLLQARGAAGSDAAAFIRVDRLEVPGVELRGQTVVALGLGSVAKVIGQPIDGVLGYDFLSRFAVRIDYPGARIGIWPAGGYEPDPGATRVPLRIESNVPRVDGVLDGEHEGSFLLDTGNSSALLLHSPFVREHGLRGDGTGGAQSVSGVGGNDTMETAAVDSLRLGDHVFRNVTALLAQAASGAVALHGPIGNVGGGLFEGCVLAFDYSAASLWIAASTADSASRR